MPSFTNSEIRSGMIFLLFLCQKMCKLLEKLLEYVLMLLKLSLILLPISGFGNQTQNQTNLIASRFSNPLNRFLAHLIEINPSNSVILESNFNKRHSPSSRYRQLN